MLWNTLRITRTHIEINNLVLSSKDVDQVMLVLSLRCSLLVIYQMVVTGLFVAMSSRSLSSKQEHEHPKQTIEGHG